MNQTLIRQAAEADIQIISRLQQQWFEEVSVYGFVPESREQIAAALGRFLLVAEACQEVVGFISGSIHISEGMAVMPEGESYLEIDNLYVSPECRRQGVGGSLITQLLAEAKEQGVSYALLYSAARDMRGVFRFYEQHDFRSWYIRMFRNL